jgi:hypothetical protein
MLLINFFSACCAWLEGRSSVVMENMSSVADFVRRGSIACVKSAIFFVMPSSSSLSTHFAMNSSLTTSQCVVNSFGSLKNQASAGDRYASLSRNSCIFS